MICRWQSRILLALLLPCALATAEPIYLVRPHGENLLLDSSDSSNYKGTSTLTERFAANGITFSIAYDDVDRGFTDPVSGAVLRRRLEDVLAYVASIVQFSNRSLDVQVTASEFDGTGALATAGTFYPGTPGIHPGSTFQRLQTGLKPFFGFPEITVTVDLGFAWNVSDGLPASDEADFFSVLLHEMTHGLGFASVMKPDGTSSLGSGIFTTYDSLLVDPRLNRRLLTDASTPLFQGDGNSLTSGALEFDGASAFDRYGIGDRVPVFSPNPEQPGSSLSHWDLGRLVGGAVMVHSITRGTIQREYAPADLGALEDLGYDHGVALSAGGCTPAKRGTESTSRADAGAVVALAGLVAALLAGAAHTNKANRPMPSCWHRQLSRWGSFGPRQY